MQIRSHLPRALKKFYLIILLKLISSDRNQRLLTRIWYWNIFIVVQIISLVLLQVRYIILFALVYLLWRLKFYYIEFNVFSNFTQNCRSIHKLKILYLCTKNCRLEANLSWHICMVKNQCFEVGSTSSGVEVVKNDWPPFIILFNNTRGPECSKYV